MKCFLYCRFVVSQNQKALHIVFPHQFLDSPEYFGVSTDDYFQVSITAIDESKVLIWHRDKLKLSIITDDFLQVVFDHILGRDVVKKLMQVSQVNIVKNKLFTERRKTLIFTKSRSVKRWLKATVSYRRTELTTKTTNRC